jgi:hypothetical protein
MARAVERWFICTGPYRIHSVKPVEGHTERIIEIEDVDRHERFMDLERLAFLAGHEQTGGPTHRRLSVGTSS